MLIAQRRPSAVIHHSDQNCKYIRYAFGKRCREAGVISSMGSLGDAYHNAMAESFTPHSRELPNSRRFKNEDGGV
jgi:transposase InsO family protein